MYLCDQAHRDNDVSDREGAAAAVEGGSAARRSARVGRAERQPWNPSSDGDLLGQG